MRIRQTLKKLQDSGIPISSEYTLNYVPHSITCQLNQSRLDAIDFNSSVPDQAEGEHSLFGNKSSSSPRRVTHSDVAMSVDLGIEDRYALKGKAKINEAEDMRNAVVIIIDDDDDDDEEMLEGNTNMSDGGIIVIDDNDDDDDEEKDLQVRRKNKGKEKVVDDDTEVKLCAEVDRSWWQCGKPVVPGYNVCSRHLERDSTLIGVKRKSLQFGTSSSARQFDSNSESLDIKKKKK